MPQEQGGAVEQEEEVTPLGPQPQSYPQQPEQQQDLIEQEQPFDDDQPQNVQPRYRPQPHMVNEVITSKVVVPRPANMYQNPAYAQQQKLPQYRPVYPQVQFRETQKTKTHREMLDEIMLKPESIDWKLAVHRYLPLDHEGVQVPRGRLLDCTIMPYDGLREEIIKTWGGGSYRVIVLNERKEAIPGIQAILIDVPVEQCAPRIHKGELTEEEQSAMQKTNALVPTHQVDDEMLAADRQVKSALAETRLYEAELKKTRAKLQQQMEFAQLVKMQKNMFSDESEEKKNGAAKQQEDQLALLREEMRKQAEQARLDREASDRKYEALLRQKELEARDKEIAALRESREREIAALKADRDRELASLREEMKRIAENNGKSSKDDQVSELKELLKEQKAQYEKQLSELRSEMKEAQRPDPNKAMTDMVTAILPAIAKKDDGSTQQLAEVMRAGQENMRQSMEMFVKMNAKDTTAQTNLVNGLIQTVMSMKQGENNPDLFLKLVKFGREQVKDAMDLAQMMGGGAGGEEGGEGGSKDESGWDAKAGFLGNVGKLLYSGFKGLVQAAQQNPQLYEVLFKLLGNRNPTDTEMAAAAHRMEMQQANLLSGTNPQALPMTPQQQQLMMQQRQQQAQMQQQRLTMAQQQQLMMQRQQQAQMQQRQLPPQMRQAGPVINPPMTPMIQTPQPQQMRPMPQHSTGMPPSVMQARPQQDPLVTPPPAAGSGTAPAVRPPVPPAARPAPAGVAVPPRVTPPTPPAPEQEVEATEEPSNGTPNSGASNEMIAAMLGVDMPLPTPLSAGDTPEQVENAEPVTEESAPSSEQDEIVVPPPQEQAVDPVQQPDPEAKPEEPDESASKEDRLRFYVTDSIQIAVDDITDKRNEHVWVSDAHSYWGDEFLRQLAAQADDGARYNLIASKCDPAMWQKLMSAMEKDETGKGYEKLFEGIRGLVQMVNEPAV